MQRIALIGSPGSGKSTLSKELAGLTGLPLYHLDALYWRPGWQPTPGEEWKELQSDLVAGERWLMDGNYGGTMEIRLQRADLVIFLDLPRWLCLWRALKRAWQNRGQARTDMAPGCPEKVDREFLSYIWHFPDRQRPKILQRLREAGVEVVHLQSTEQVEAYRRQIRSGSGRGLHH